MSTIDKMFRQVLSHRRSSWRDRTAEDSSTGKAVEDSSIGKAVEDNWQDGPAEDNREGRVTEEK